tara:strand:+ start:566 stop:802 length:237 start_codon:yes stop_codon:yes gene_type:complete
MNVNKIKEQLNLSEAICYADYCISISNNKSALEQINIADKYAINFVAWLDRNKKETKRIIIIEELLEMYKNDIRRDNS